MSVLKKTSRFWRQTIFCSLAIFLPAAPGYADVRTLRIVGDDNYPPYLFRAPDGRIEGYLADLWQLWQDKTGLKVELTATKWAEAQRMIGRGDADVIDMIFRTPQREALYDFSPPYADLPVAIYSHASISGITQVGALRGFQIGVQEGDACIDKLQSHGISELRYFVNYTDMINAAMAEEVKIFCLDEYPANYYLYRMGKQHEFRKAFELYRGQFHRAVRKGDIATLQLIERGMAAIGAEEQAALRKKWFGEPIDMAVYGRYVFIGLIALAIAGLGLMLWNGALHRRVKKNTLALSKTIEQLLSAQQVLQQIQDDQVATLEAIPDLLMEMDETGRIVQVKSWRDSVLKQPKQSWPGKQIKDLFPDEAADVVLESIRVSSQAGSDYGRLIRLPFPDGERWLELSAARKPCRNGQPMHFIILSRDVTERQLAASRLARVKDFYAAISEINETIIHATSDQQLFEDICRIAVERGRMNMAWIGIEEAETRRVVPMAKYGQCLRYLDDIVISTRADLPEGQGVSGSVWRQQKALINNDIASNPTMTPWLAKFREYGWQSSACFPIFRAGSIHALLTVYNTDIDVIDEKISGLLNAMAAEISFGLASLDARQTLTESEARYRLLAENGSDVIWLFDLASNRFAYISPSVEKLRGYTVEEALQQDMRKAMTPESFNKLSRQLPKRFAAFATGDAATWIEEVALIHKDGGTVITESAVSLIGDGQGRPVQIQGVTRNIAERKRAEAALLEKESQYRAAIEASPDGFWVVDTAGRFQEVNDAISPCPGTAGKSS